MARQTTAVAGAPELRSDAARNREEILRVATIIVLRDGPGVPLNEIAAQAGVGVATLYRNFPDRESLMGELTYRSFELLLDNAVLAQAEGNTPIDQLRRFIEATMRQRARLVLPMHGGPNLVPSRTRDVQRQLHAIIRQIVQDGQDAGIIRAEVQFWDVIILGSMVAQPKTRSPTWQAACDRLLHSFLRGLAP